MRIFEGRDALKNWFRCLFQFKVPVVLYLAGAFLIPILIGVLHYLLYHFLGGAAEFEYAVPWYQYLAYLIPTALLTGGNEEPGWRGFALPVLNNLTNPLAAGLILGVVHALWHLPLMDQYGTTIVWYIFGLIPLTFLFNWFYLHSRGSIWPVMLFHSGTNVIGSFIPAPQPVLGGMVDFVILRGLVYWLMAAVLVIVTRRFWFQHRPSEIVPEA
jgi:membrane protease YdiL (CAAX protease family)